MFYNIISSVEGIVASSAWPTTYKTYPAGFKGAIPEKTYLTYDTQLSEVRKSGYPSVELQGIVFISIFYPATESKRYAAAIADGISTVLDRSLFSNREIQTDTASLQFLGPDPKNTTFQRADLSIPFVYRGE